MSDVPAAGDGTLERTADGGVIRFERRLAYPIRDVWDAVTDPARLADWLLPFDADITVDLREGGEMVFAGRGEEPVTMTFTILRVEPPMLLEHTHADASYLRWELEPVDTGCVLRLTHFVTDTAGAIDNCYVVGLHASLARLEPCLAGRPVAWDWDGFAAAQAHYARLGLAPPVEAS
ncbi:MAG: SRPBCC family protein [Acidimicrobiales bacterium]|nr:SRPBCC family protein [Acidimicrobiales bacterium]